MAFGWFDMILQEHKMFMLMASAKTYVLLQDKKKKSNIFLFCSSQGCGALRPPHHSAGPAKRTPGCLHHTQQHRLLPERTQPQSDPGPGRQLPAPRKVHVRHHHAGKRAWGGAAVRWAGPHLVCDLDELDWSPSIVWVRCDDMVLNYITYFTLLELLCCLKRILSNRIWGEWIIAVLQVIFH